MDTQIETFTSKKASRFFTKSEYEHIGHDFNFDALAELTDPNFAEKVKDELHFCYIKKLVIEERESCFFLYFYAQDYRKEDYRIIKAYHNKEDYFSLNSIGAGALEILGLDIKRRVKKK